MYTLFLCAALGIFIGTIFAYKCENRNVADFTGYGFIGILVGSVAGMVIGMFLGVVIPRKDFVGEPVTLVSMRSADGINGSFLWGSGSVRSEVTYNFMQLKADKSMTPGSVYANDVVRLFEDPELKTIGYWRTTIRKADSSHWLYKWTLFTSDNDRIVRQEFRVPVGSVIQQFNIK